MGGIFFAQVKTSWDKTCLILSQLVLTHGKFGGILFAEVKTSCDKIRLIHLKFPFFVPTCLRNSLRESYDNWDKMRLILFQLVLTHGKFGGILIVQVNTSRDTIRLIHLQNPIVCPNLSYLKRNSGVFLFAQVRKSWENHLICPQSSSCKFRQGGTSRVDLVPTCWSSPFLWPYLFLWGGGWWTS